MRLRRRSASRAGRSSLAYDEYAALLAPRDPGASAAAPLPTVRDRGRAVLREALVLLFFLLLAVYKAGMWRDLGGSVFAGPDPLKDVWVLDWVTRHLYQPARLFEGNNFFPSHDAILFNDPLLGPALLAAPVALAGRGPVLAYNVAVLLTLMFGSAGFYLLARRLGADPRAALVAAVTVPYMPPQMQHLSHLNLLSLGGFAFLVLGLLRLLRAPSAAVACATGFAFAWQAGTSGYWAFAAVVLSLMVAAFEARALSRPRVLASAALAAAVAAVLLLPYVRGFHALRTTEAALARSTADRADLSLDLVSGLWGTGAWVWQGVMPGPDEAATLAFPGMVVLLLAAAAVWRGPRRPVLRLVVIGLVFFALALGPRVKALGRDLGPGPLAAFEAAVPFFSAVRHPATFAALTLAALGVLAALGASALGLTRRWWSIAAVLAAALVEADTPPHRRVPVPAALPAVYTRLQARPRAGVLELPITAEGDSARQWWSVQHGLTIVNGVGAFRPDRYLHLTRLIGREWTADAGGSFEDTSALRFLKHQFPIGYVVVHAEAPEALRSGAERTPSLERLFEEGGARVYRLRNGGRGRRLRRAFRDDQFKEGVLSARLQGTAGSRARVAWNDDALEDVALSVVPRDMTWPVRDRLRRGLNTLVLTAEGPPEAEVVLLEAAPR